MSYVSNVTILTCDYRGCTTAFVPSINKGRQALRQMAIEAGWSCTKRGQWTDVCPEHVGQLQAQSEAL